MTEKWRSCKSLLRKLQAHVDRLISLLTLSPPWVPSRRKHPSQPGMTGRSNPWPTCSWNPSRRREQALGTIPSAGMSDEMGTVTIAEGVLAGHNYLRNRDSDVCPLYKIKTLSALLKCITHSVRHRVINAYWEVRQGRALTEVISSYVVWI